MYDKLAGLEFEIEEYKLVPLEIKLPEFTRKTTLVRLAGHGTEGVGEDVTYDPKSQEAFQQNGQALDLAGKYSLDSFSQKIGGLNLFTDKPQQEVFRNYRRWALESAALGLALKQNGTTLAKVLARQSQPLNFVVSRRLGEKGDTKPIEDILALYPNIRFKLDPTPDWTDSTIDRLAKTGAVDTVDFKGQYKGTVVDTEPDLALYKKIVEAFPQAYIEDPHSTPEILDFLKPYASRVTWDAPLHSVADINDAPIKPRVINVKPSRFGSIKELLSVYDYCFENKIGMYGGGQFELGEGRSQIQYLASLFHPDTPNDVAPKGFNEPEVKPGLESPPLPIKPTF